MKYILLFLLLCSCSLGTELLHDIGIPISDAAREAARQVDADTWSWLTYLLLGIGGVGATAKVAHVVVKKRRAKKEGT